MTGPSLSRRDFGRTLGALTIAFGMGAPALAADAAALPGSLARNRRLDAWLRIGADGKVTIFTGKVELGQGILTALLQIAADELDVAPERITLISGDTAQTPDEGFTSGSQSIEQGGTALRYACAEARSVLLALAIRRFGPGAYRVKVTDGVISGRADQSATYWELVAEAKLTREATAAVSPKAPEELRLVGTSRPRLDIPAKVTGGAAYVQDLRLPGMLFGRVVRPSGWGATLAAFDAAPLQDLPGVVALVRDGSFLGVVAAREEQAIAARDAVARAAHWSEAPALPRPEDIHRHLRSLPAEDHVISRTGYGPVLDTGPALSAVYTRPYIAHAAIGPSCAVAQWTEGKLTVWTHSQGVFPLRRDLAKALDLELAQIRCIHMEGSGCYGHNGADDVALDAALLARAAGGKPVKVQWMRDDEFRWEPYGPAMSVAASARLDRSGAVVDWTYDLWSNTHTTRPQPDGVNLLAAWHLARPKAPGKPERIPLPAGGGDRNALPLYDFAQQQVTHHFIGEMPIRVSALRALGA